MRLLLAVALACGVWACGGKGEKALQGERASEDAPAQAAERAPAAPERAPAAPERGPAPEPVQHELAAPSNAAPEASKRAPTSAQPKLAELAGEWSGTATVPGYGSAVGSLTLDRKGAGHYFVSLSGMTRRGPLRLLSWTGSWMLVRAEGRQERLHATHKGEHLWVEVPLVGQILLTRRPRN